jgi:hypothetical protein
MPPFEKDELSLMQKIRAKKVHPLLRLIKREPWMHPDYGGAWRQYMTPEIPAPSSAGPTYQAGVDEGGRGLGGLPHFANTPETGALESVWIKDPMKSSDLKRKLLNKLTYDPFLDPLSPGFIGPMPENPHSAKGAWVNPGRAAVRQANKILEGFGPPQASRIYGPPIPKELFGR